MQTTSNTLDVLAADATRIAQDARALEAKVAAAVDRIAARDAREAALHLEDLAGVLGDPELEVGR